jgi:hypothetical protein
MDFVSTIQREWPVISQAPWSIGAIGIAFLGMGGVVGYFLGNERIRIVDFLSEKLDQSYVRRLRSNAGLSPVAPVGNLTNDQQNLWKLVNHRIERLNQFLSELS